MPTYEFRCPEGHEFERFYRKVSDAPGQMECPQCGKLSDRVLSGGAGILFKGSGFYLTDYGKNAHRKSGGTGGEAKKGESASGGGESKSGDGGSSGGGSGTGGSGSSSGGTSSSGGGGGSSGSSGSSGPSA